MTGQNYLIPYNTGSNNSLKCRIRQSFLGMGSIEIKSNYQLILLININMKTTMKKYLFLLGLLPFLLPLAAYASAGVSISPNTFTTSLVNQETGMITFDTQNSPSWGYLLDKTNQEVLVGGSSYLEYSGYSGCLWPNIPLTKMISASNNQCPNPAPNIFPLSAGNYAIVEGSNFNWTGSCLANHYSDCLNGADSIADFTVSAPPTPPTSSISSNFQQIIQGANTLLAAIVDASYTPVTNPAIAMSPVTYGLSCQTSTGNFGTATQQIYVKNIGAADSGWTLTLAGAATSSAWTSSSASANYSFNNPNSSGCAYGQMTVNPSVGTLSVGQCQNGCTTNHLSLGSSASFSNGSTDSITLLSATAAADHTGDWTLKNIAVSQKIPAGQAAANDYNINMVLTVTAY